MQARSSRHADAISGLGFDVGRRELHSLSVDMGAAFGRDAGPECPIAGASLVLKAILADVV